jgi:hypothetical protein
MKIQLVASALILGLSVSSVAVAADICVSDAVTGPSKIAFRKVKKLKPGGAVTLAGVGIYAGGTPYAVTGTAAMTGTGIVKVSVLLGAMSPGSCPAGCINAAESLVLDADFNGTGNFDADGDNAVDSATTWTAIDCDTVVIP